MLDPLFGMSRPPGLANRDNLHRVGSGRSSSCGNHAHGGAHPRTWHFYSARHRRQLRMPSFKRSSIRLVPPEGYIGWHPPASLVGRTDHIQVQSTRKTLASWIYPYSFGQSRQILRHQSHHFLKACPIIDSRHCSGYREPQQPGTVIEFVRPVPSFFSNIVFSPHQKCFHG